LRAGCSTHLIRIVVTINLQVMRHRKKKFFIHETLQSWPIVANRRLTHSEAPQRSGENHCACAASVILAKRFPEKSNEKKSDLRFLVV
jgi:hypothetical protein